MVEVKETALVPAVSMAPVGLPSREVLQAHLEWAQCLIKSGVLPDHLRKPETVVAVIQRGRELGIPPLEACNSLYPVHGKIASDTKTMLALAWRSGVLGEFTVLEMSDTIARVRVGRKGCPPQEFSFTMEEALRLGVAKATAAKPEKGAQYRSQPAQMLLWRAGARGLRIVVPDAIMGLYTYEEMNLPVRFEDDNMVLDSKAVIAQENGESRKAGADEMKDELARQFAGNGEKSAEAGAADGNPVRQEADGSPARGASPAAHSADPVCPTCCGEMWDNRDRRAEAEAEIAAGTRQLPAKGKPKRAPPAWKCKDTNCKGVIWPSEPETDAGERTKDGEEHETPATSPLPAAAPAVPMLTPAQYAEFSALGKRLGMTAEDWKNIFAAHHKTRASELTGGEAELLIAEIKKMAAKREVA